MAVCPPDHLLAVGGTTLFVVLLQHTSNHQVNQIIMDDSLCEGLGLNYSSCHVFP